MAIVLQTVSDSKQAQDDLAKLKQSVDSIQKSTEKVSKSLLDFGKAFVIGGSVVAGVRAFVEYSDILTNMENRIRVVTDSQKDFKSALTQVKRIAIDTRSDLGAIANLYTKITLNSKEMKASQQQVAAATSSVAKSLAISGASAEEAKAAIQQFGQAMASGKLAGDEFRSVLENAPILAQEIAKGLGVSLGKMYQLRNEGKLTSSQVFRAILKTQNDINEKFGKMKVTYGQAFTNLGTSFVLLFDSVRKTFLGSSGAVPEMINNWAKSIAEFADNFHFYMFRMKSQILLFTLNGILAFEELWDTVSSLGKKAFDAVIGYIAKFNPALAGMIKGVVGSATTSIATIPSLYKKVMGDVAKVGLFPALLLNAKSLVSTIGEVLSRIGSFIKPIDVSKFLPGLGTALNYVKQWAKAVEGWFFWIWDRVIGHSWIPDLVEDTHSWLSKLSDGPLKSVISFAKQVSKVFQSLAEYIGGVLQSGFEKLFGTTKKAKKDAASIVDTVHKASGAQDNSVRFIGQNVSNASPSNELRVYKDFTSALNEASKKPTEPKSPGAKSVSIVDKVKERTDAAVKGFNSSTFTHFMKQFLGLRDTTPGSLFGSRIRNDSYVGLGPQRTMKWRIPGHDQINALPKEDQLPTVLAITALFAAGIAGALKGGPVREAAFFLLTTGAGVFIAKALDSKVVHDQIIGWGFFILKGLRKGIDTLFGGNVAKDPFGFLALYAKIALLFKAGREFFGKGALSIATSPTKAVRTLNDAIDAKKLGKQIEAYDKRLTQAREKLDDKALEKQVYDAEKKFASSLNGLARKMDATGNKIGNARARLLVADPNSINNTKLSPSTKAGIAFAQAVEDGLARARGELNNRKGLVQRRDDAASLQGTLRARVNEHGQKLKEGLFNLSSGAGGIVGSAAGFQIGEQIAEGMENSPAWAKIAVTLVSAMAGQAIFAAIGGIIASSFLLALGVARAALALLFAPAITALGAVVTSSLAAIGAGLAAVFAPIIAAVTGFVAAVGIVPIAIGAAAVALIAGIVIFRKQLFDPEWWKRVGKWIVDGWNRFFDPENLGGRMAQGFVGFFSRHSDLVAATVQTRAQNDADRAQGKDPGFFTTVGRYVKNFTQDHLARAPGALPGLPGGGFSPFSAPLPDNLLPPQYRKVKPKPVTPVEEDKSLSERAGEFGDSVAGFKLPDFLGGGTVGETFDKLKKGFLSPPKPPSAPGGGGGSSTMDAFNESAQNFYQNALEQGTTLASSLGKLTEGINKYTSLDRGIAAGEGQDKLKGGAGGDGVGAPASVRLAPEDLKVLGGDQQKKIAETLDTIAKFNAIAARAQPGSYVRETALAQVAEGKQVLQELVDVAKFQTGKVSAEGIVDTPLGEDEKKKRKDRLRVGDDFNMINEMFPKLQLTVDEFNNFSAEARDQLTTAALGLKRSTEFLERLPLGTTSPDQIVKLRAEIEKSRKKEYANLKPVLRNERTPFAQLKQTVEESGINLNEDLYNAFDEATRRIVVDNVERAAEARRTASDNSLHLSQAALTQLAADAYNAQRIAQDFLEEFQSNIGKSRIAVIANDFDAAGIRLDLEDLNLFSDQALETLDALAQRIKEINKRLARENLSPDERTSLLNERKANTEKLEDASNIAQRRKMSESAGKALAQSINDTLTTGVSEFIKGKRSFKGLIMSLMDRITNDLIDSFVASFLEPITGSTSRFNRTVSKLGEAALPFGRPDAEQTQANAYDPAGSWLQTLPFIKKDPVVPPQFPTPPIMSDSPETGGITGGLNLQLPKSFDFSQPQTPVGQIDLSGIDSVTADFSQASDTLSYGLDYMPNLTDSINTAFPARRDSPSCCCSGAGAGGAGAGILGALGGQGDAGEGGGGVGGLLQNGLGGLMSKLKNGLGGLMSKLKDGNVGLYGLLGGIFGKFLGGMFAEGGVIKGPGNGTSDSILAAVSTGEFITNASATRKNLPLLKAINSGKFSLDSIRDMPRFAEGGMVGALAGAQLIPSTQPSRGYVDPKHVGSNGKSGDTTVNLQIVGDVSKQTKAQIVRMLPEIAQGVNAHNREKGYRG